jgi:hypothetical protein
VADTVRVLTRSAATITWQPTDQEGELTAASGTPTVTVTRADGTVILGLTPTLGAGVVSLTIPATSLTEPDQLDVVWLLDAVARGETAVDVVGAPLITETEVRAREPALANVANYPAATIRRAIAEVAARFERSVPAVSFVPRLSVVDTYVTSSRLSIPYYFGRAVRWVQNWQSSAWVDVDYGYANLLEGGGFELTNWYRSGAMRVGFEHGLDAPPPDVKKAAARAVRHVLISPASGLDPRAMSYQPPEGGNVTLATPGLGPWEFGLPDVDAVLKSWRQSHPTLAAA